MRRTTYHVPVVISACADCGLGTLTAGEWYMINDEVWEQAWRGRRKTWQALVAGQEVLCIGCLEQRIGRTLMACDFTDMLVNDSNKENVSERLRDRFTARQSTLKSDRI